MIHFSVKSKTKQTPNSDTEKIVVVIGGAGAGGGVERMVGDGEMGKGSQKFQLPVRNK